MSAIKKIFVNRGKTGVEHNGHTFHGVYIEIIIHMKAYCMGRCLSATGIRGIIDVMDPENPYGAASIIADIKDDTTRNDLR